MRNKNFRTSNADTEDDEESETNRPSSTKIVDVWSHNFTHYLTQIQHISQTHTYIALDTQFPGNPVKKHHLPHSLSQEDAEYQLLWHNIEKTKLIQIGLSLADPSGQLPDTPTYQFHLAFNLPDQHVDPQSIVLLKNAGINFHQLPAHGIPPARFAQGLISSGLILNKDIRWIVYHGCYDFAYLLKLLRDESLPPSAEEFYKSIHIYFPNIYDLKEVVKNHENFREGGLNSLANKLGCLRIGPKHQAGSDSLLTINTYFQLRNVLGIHPFDQNINLIYGISRPAPKIATSIQYPSYNNQSNERGPLYQYLQHNSMNWSYSHQSSGFGFGRRN